MEKAHKKLISVKISKIDQHLKFMESNMQCSKDVKLALSQIGKEKKRFLHKRLNKNQQRLGPKKFEVNEKYKFLITSLKYLNSCFVLGLCLK